MKSENTGEKKMSLRASSKITPTYDFDSEARQALARLLHKSAETSGNVDDRIDILLKKGQEEVREKCRQSLKNTLKELAELERKFREKK